MYISNFGIILRLLWFITLFFIISIESKASTKPLHVAIFIPFGLDNIYTMDPLKRNFKLQDTNNVDYNEEAWNFYIGTKMAIDSLMQEKTAVNHPIFFHYYDVVNIKNLQGLDNIIKNQNYHPDLLIGFVFGDDFQNLANFARAEKIPFVSTIYPNLHSQQDNEFLLVLNPILHTHIRAILHSIREKNINIIMKRGEYPEILHNIIQNVKQDIDEEKIVKYITMDTFESSLRLHLNLAQARDNNFFLLTFDQEFIKKILMFFNNISNKDKIYHLSGLPLWDDFPFMQSFMPKYMQLTYTRGLYYNPANPLVEKLKNNYQYYYFSPFNDMVGLGFESLYVFTSLLQKYPDFKLWSKNIKDIEHLSLSNFDLQPYADNDFNGVLINKKIYFRLMKNRRSTYLEQNY